MIRPLRQRHRRVFTALALLLPAAWTAAILARPLELAPATEALVESPFSAVEPLALATAADLGPWGDLPLSAVVGTDGAGRALVEFRASAPLAAADLLVYWTPSWSPGAELAADARLLGRLGRGPARWPLPRASGWLVLYDLARAELVAARALPGTAEEP